jgi:hypothetical protein
VAHGVQLQLQLVVTRDRGEIMESKITTHVTSTDGTVYLRTQHGESAEDIAEALKPYVDRFAHFYPPNLYGHINPHRSTRGWIRAVNGTRVTVEVPSTGYTGEVDAFDAFGSYCTIIEPQRVKE